MPPDTSFPISSGYETSVEAAHQKEETVAVLDKCRRLIKAENE
jgi:hypothetical protein